MPYQYVVDLSDALPRVPGATLYYCREEDRYQLVSYRPDGSQRAMTWDGPIFRKKYGEDFRQFFRSKELQRQARKAGR